MDSIPDYYMNDNIRLLSAENPTPFLKSVDVINYGLGIRYVSKVYGGWMKGSFDFSVDGKDYMLWFPKVSLNGKAASSSGWVNEIHDGGKTIIERAPEQKNVNDYRLNNRIRLVFIKQKKEPYYFYGVFLPEREQCTDHYHVFKKVADIADFRGDHPEISFFNSETAKDKEEPAEKILSYEEAKKSLSAILQNPEYRIEIKPGKTISKTFLEVCTSETLFRLWIHPRENRYDLHVISSRLLNVIPKLIDFEGELHREKNPVKTETYRGITFDQLMLVCEYLADKTGTLFSFSVIPPLDETHSIEEQVQQAETMDPGSLKAAAEKNSKLKPVKKEVTTSQIQRDPYIAEYAKWRANGFCQLCGKEAPFQDKKGKPYLESHHIVWLSRGGPDSVQNTVALCPNCHKRMHVLDNREDIDILLERNR